MGDPASWVILGLVGGLVGVDATALGQAMVSRPIVAATLGAWVFGRPAEGLILGAALELFELCILPVGAARTPEGGTGALAAGAAYAVAAPAGLAPVPLALALAFGLIAERLAGETVVFLRRVNGRLVGDAALDAMRGARALVARHLTGIGLDFARGAGVSVAAALAGSVLLRALPDVSPDMGRAASVMMALVLPGMAGAGAAALAGGARVGAFLAGLAVGSGLWLVL
ncbi:MAG TPA: PTS sugar transporter subunit IIC [Longimicrobiales bacterium]|nr:PTS sugar transporter subunit IIC [Longimicrobiales bacterium]